MKAGRYPQWMTALALMLYEYFAISIKFELTEEEAFINAVKTAFRKEKKNFNALYELSNVIEDKISASYENGILRITMPKLVEEKKNINITIA